MTVKIELSDQQAAALQAKAATLGLSLEDWFQRMASQQSPTRQPHRDAGAAAAHILELQRRVKPDPEGWTSRDYINFGRR
jgi:hypothetical protein